MRASDQGSILITRLRSHSALRETITSKTRFGREKVRARACERETGWLERWREREGLRGGGGGERLTLDQCLLFSGSVLRPADGQNRRRRELARIPAERRPSGTLAGKTRCGSERRRASSSLLLFSSFRADRGSVFSSDSDLASASFSVCTFDTLIAGQRTHPPPRSNRRSGSLAALARVRGPEK